MRQRHRDGGDSTPDEPEGPVRASDTRRRARDLGDELLSSIENALSGDSEAFIRSSRQQGGQ